MGFEAKENNFYLRLSDFRMLDTSEKESNTSNTDQIKNKPDSGNVMALISSYLDKNGDIGFISWSRVVEDRMFIKKFKSLVKNVKCLD